MGKGREDAGAGLCGVGGEGRGGGGLLHPKYQWAF